MGSGSPPPGQDPVVRTGGDRPIPVRALPLRLVVAGRFGLAPGRLHRLDGNGAGGLLQRTAPTLALRVADRLRADGTDLTIELGFSHRRDFAPGSVARAVPDLARLLAAHTALRSGAGPAALRDDLADFPAVRGALDDGAGDASAVRAPASSGGAADDSVDRLLDMVDAPGAAPAGNGGDLARSAVTGFIAEVTRGAIRRPGGGTPPEILETLLAEQIEAILAHPDFVALERSWAALRFLARRLDMRSALAVDVVEADADTVADALEALVPEDDLDGAGPVRLVVDLNDYDASDRDMARLRRLAAFGASRRAVVLSNADPGFCGDAGPDALAGMHDPQTLFETARYAGWQSLRDMPEAAWLGLCLSRLALRDATDGRDDRTLRFVRPRRVGRLLDVGAAPAVASLIAGAAAATGWACAVGSGIEPVVDNLVLAHDAAAGFDGPVRPALGMNAAESLASGGLIALVPAAGRDTARLSRLTAVRRSAETLTSRLFQAQVIHGLQWNADRIFGSADPAALRDRVEACLAALLAGTGPGAGAEVRVAKDESDETVLVVHVRSGARAAPGASLAFDIPLGPGATLASGEP